MAPTAAIFAPLVLDARNIWRPADVTRAGLRYRGIGVAANGPTEVHS